MSQGMHRMGRRSLVGGLLLALVATVASAIQEEAPLPPSLLLLRMDAGDAEQLSVSGELDSLGQEIILRMMYTLGRTPRADGRLRASARPPADEGLRQWEVYKIVGRATLVTKVPNPLPAEEHLSAAQKALKASLPEYYSCRIATDGGREVDVLVARVPKAWPIGEPIDEPVDADAILLRLPGTDGLPGPEVPVLLANHIAWRSTDTELGRLGMDVGLLDDAVPRTRLTAADRDVFYAMLQAVGRAKPGELRRLAREELKATGEEYFSVVPLFNDPQAQIGRLVELDGYARRVTLIRVTDAIAREQYGVDHFYQVYIITDDSQPHPLVFCVRELPEGMPTGDGPEFREPVRVAGFFFKTWAYRGSAPQEEDGTEPPWELAPMLIGRAAQWTPPKPESPARYVPVRYMVAAVLIGIVVLMQLRRRQRRTKSAGEMVAEWHKAAGPPPESS